MEQRNKKGMVENFLSTVNPSYTRLSKHDQYMFKLAPTDDASNENYIRMLRRFNNYILYGLFGSFINDDDMTVEQKIETNSTTIYFHGIGNNYLVITSTGWWNRDILKCNTIFDHAKQWHDLQEDAFSKEFENYTKEDIKNNTDFWARAILDEKFYYLSLSSPVYWILSELERNLEVKLSEITDNALSSKAYNIIDILYDNIYDRLVNMDLGSKVFIKDTTDEHSGPYLTLVFGNLDVMSKISIENFWKDVNENLGDWKILEDIVSEELKIANDLLTNFLTTGNITHE